MSTHQARIEFAPPPTPGLLRALGLAIAAHALLLLVLAAGVQWKHQAPPVTVEAELWSAVPQDAAPPPVVEPEPVALPPEPVQTAAPPPVMPSVTPIDPSIAIAQEKARLQKEKALQQEKLSQERQKLARLEQEKNLKEKQQQDKLAKEKETRLKEAREKAAREKVAADKAKQQDANTAAAEAKKMAELRQQNLQRMAGLAAGTGSANATGTAAQSSGPSPGYYGRVAARIKANLVYTESTVGNPRVEVDIRIAPSGSILSVKIAQSSGIKTWDDAVVRAIEKTETLPADIDGKVPNMMQFAFRPKD